MLAIVAKLALHTVALAECSLYRYAALLQKQLSARSLSIGVALARCEADVTMLSISSDHSVLMKWLG